MKLIPVAPAPDRCDTDIVLSSELGVADRSWCLLNLSPDSEHDCGLLMQFDFRGAAPG
ncbi:hypothetical protein ACMDCT_13180 [Halomonadaceae bacterium KBTZ08]